MIDSLNNHVNYDECSRSSDTRGAVDDDRTGVSDRRLFGANIHEESQHTAGVAGNSVVRPYSKMIMPEDETIDLRISVACLLGSSHSQ